MGDERASDLVGQIRQALGQVNRQLELLSQFDGAQNTRAIAKLQELIDGILTQVNGVFSGYVQAGGNITSTSGIVQADAGLWSTSVYNDVLVSSWRNTFTRSDGKLGYVPSSRRFKRDIRDAKLGDILATIRLVRIVTFRYIGAVKVLGKEADTEWGVIAEEMHELGLTWLVDYDDDGLPFGVKKEQFFVLLIMGMQEQDRQIQDLTNRLDRAGL